MQSHELEALAGRLDKLERQNRRLKWTVFAVPLIGTALIGLVAADPGKDTRKDTVITQNLILQDEKGKTTATLTTEKDGPHFVLYDRKGKVRVRIAADFEGKGPAVFLLDKKDNVRATLRTLEDGGPAFHLFGEKEKHWITMGGHSDNGVPFIQLQDRDGKVIWAVGGTNVKK